MRTFGLVLGMAGAVTVVAEPLDRGVARVNGHLMLASDVRFARAVGLAGVKPAEDEASAVRRLIDRELAVVEVLRTRPQAPDPAVVTRQRAALVAVAGGEAAAADAVRQAGLPPDHLDRVARETVWVESYLRQRFGEDPAQPARSAWLADLRRRGTVHCFGVGC